MRAKTILLLIFWWAAGPVVGQGTEDPPLDQLLNSKELIEYRRDSDYKDRIGVFADALKRYSLVLRDQVDAKKVDEILETLHRLQSLAHYAAKEPLPAKGKEARSGEVRKLEIRIRKLSEDIQDAKAIAPFEYHVEFDSTLGDLRALRSKLLAQMFGPAHKERERPDESNNQTSPDVERLLQPAFGFGLTLRYQPEDEQQEETRYSTEISGDQFTEVEYDKIRDNQDLVHRVNVLLDIAESRLNEIRRRMNNEPWTEKEANPLEFYTFEQMVHAYDRAISSAMVNIDEKVKHKLATQKQVKKTLEKLNKKIMEFTPQLGPIKEVAVKNKDEILYREVLQAEKSSEIARKGTLYGLGSPVQ